MLSLCAKNIKEGEYTPLVLLYIFVFGAMLYMASLYIQLLV